MINITTQNNYKKRSSERNLKQTQSWQMSLCNLAKETSHPQTFQRLNHQSVSKPCFSGADQGPPRGYKNQNANQNQVNLHQQTTQQNQLINDLHLMPACSNPGANSHAYAKGDKGKYPKLPKLLGWESQRSYATLLGTSWTQHGETYPGYSEVRAESRETEL